MGSKIPHYRDHGQQFTKLVSRFSPRGWRRAGNTFCLEHIQTDGEYILAGDDIDDLKCYVCGKHLSKAVSVYSSQTTRSGKTSWL